jgi:hypothetical protein
VAANHPEISMRRLALVALALASLSPLALAAPAAPKGAWDGFGDGSWVQMRTTTKMEMPGVAMPEQVMEQKMTLVKTTEEEWVVKVESKMGETAMPANEVHLPRKAAAGMPAATPDAPKPEDLGTETVSVDGKDYACKKLKSVAAGMTSITWVSDEVGLLKIESEGNGTTTSFAVTSLAKKAKVGDKEVTCREQKQTTKMAGTESTSVMLMSDEVPMGMVRSDTSTTGAAASKMTMEVVGFEKK